ncbi:hypothetical protein D3C81_892160 [compost metagenome]
MPFLEEHLQATQADGHGDDAGIVGALQQFPVRRLLLQAIEQAGDHQKSRRDVDIEDVFPAEVLGQPAAQGRSDGRSEGGGDGEQRHALGALMIRQLDQRQGERQRDQCAAGETL